MTRMWAVERYLGHWDGYTTKNNYYLVSDPSGRFQMLPWGTDQTWVERPRLRRRRWPALQQVPGRHELRRALSQVAAAGPGGDLPGPVRRARERHRDAAGTVAGERIRQRPARAQPGRSRRRRAEHAELHRRPPGRLDGLAGGQTGSFRHAGGSDAAAGLARRRRRLDHDRDGDRRRRRAATRSPATTSSSARPTRAWRSARSPTTATAPTRRRSPRRPWREHRRSPPPIPGPTPTSPRAAVLTQTPGPAAHLALALQPASIPADGASTTTATATVTDANGNPVPDDQVAFSSTDPAQRIGPTRDHGDGTYTAPITASTAVGTATIAVTDTSVVPGLTASAPLTQLAVAKPIVDRPGRDRASHPRCRCSPAPPSAAAIAPRPSASPPMTRLRPSAASSTTVPIAPAIPR